MFVNVASGASLHDHDSSLLCRAMKRFRHPVSIAPMMQRTDRHFRTMMRLITRRTLLYTEMVVAQSLKYGDHDRLLGYSSCEHPLALQIGGDDPGLLAYACELAEERGYDEVNLNVGCPSPRVQKGNFGACLMQDPQLVAECVRAMRSACSIPVTVKHRIGVDDQEDWEDLSRFVATVAKAGCARFTVHARKAWLDGLSPAENREIPPIKYDVVYRLKREFPELVIEINGHIKTVSEMKEHLERVDAVMIGRAAYDDPMVFADVDTDIYHVRREPLDRDAVVEAMVPYVAEQLAAGARLPSITRHMLNLYTGQPGGRLWRRYITENAVKRAADERVLSQALDVVREARARVREHRGDPERVAR